MESHLKRIEILHMKPEQHKYVLYFHQSEHWHFLFLYQTLPERGNVTTNHTFGHTINTLGNSMKQTSADCKNAF